MPRSLSLRVRYRLGAAVLLGAVTTPAAAAALTAPAQAAVACSTTVVADDANILDDNTVARAAEGIDASVAVVTFTSTPGKDIDKAVDEYRLRCGADGARSLVLAISHGDRLSGVYYGGGLSADLDDGWESINSAMQAQFPDDFTLGVTDALDVADGLLNGTAGAPAMPDLSGLDPAADTSSTPVDVPWAWILGVPAGGAVLGGAGYGAVVYRRRVAARDKARASALALTNEAALAFDNLDSSKDLTAAHLSALPDVRDSVLDDLRAHGKGVVGAVDAAIGVYLTHTDAWPDVKIAGADFETAGAAEESARGARDAITLAARALSDLDSELSDLEAQFAAAPRVLDGVDALLADSLQVADGLDADGYRTAPYRATAAAIAEQAAEARTAHSTNQWGRAVTLADDASAKTNTLNNALTGLRHRRQRIVDDLAGLRKRHTAMEHDVVAANATAAKITGAYHSECSDKANAAAASTAKSHAYAPEALANGVKAVDMTVQDFDEAETCVIVGTQALDSADASAKEVHRIEAELAELTTKLPVSLDDLRRKAGQIVATMQSNGQAMKFLSRRVKRSAIDEALAAIGADLSASHPRLYTLRGNLTDAGRLITDERRLVDETVSAYNDAVSLVSRAESAVRDAERETSRPHSGSSSKSLLRDAEASLAAARTWSSLAQVASDAQSAISKAADAESRARSAIREHEEEQERERRRVAAAASAAASYSPSSSSSWGSSDSGGGGSSSWGGGGGSSGSGGGGSSSW